MLINRFEISPKMDFSFSPTPWETDGEASNPGPPGDRPSQPNPPKIPRLSDSTEAPHYTEAPNPTDAPSHRAPSACVPYPPVAPPPSLAFTPTPFAPERHQPLARSKPPNETPHAKKIKRSAPDRPTPVVRQAPTATTPLPLPPSPAQTVRNAYPGSLARKFPRPPSAQFLGPRSISAPLPPSSDLFARTKMKITAARTDARTDTPDHSHFHQPSSHSYVASFGATRDTKNSYWKSSERRLTSPTDMSPTTSPGKLEGVYTYRLRNSGRALAIKANPNTPSIAPTSPRSTCDAPQRPALPEASTTLRPKIQNHSAPTFKNLISQGGAIAQDASPTLVSPARATPALLKPHCGQIAKHASPNMRTATRPSLRRSEHLPSSAPTSPRLSIYIGPINKKKRDETFGKSAFSLQYPGAKRIFKRC